jgi:hypothetical protein
VSGESSLVSFFRICTYSFPSLLIEKTVLNSKLLRQFRVFCDSIRTSGLFFLFMRRMSLIFWSILHLVCRSVWVVDYKVIVCLIFNEHTVFPNGIPTKHMCYAFSTFLQSMVIFCLCWLHKKSLKRLFILCMFGRIHRWRHMVLEVLIIDLILFIAVPTWHSISSWLNVGKVFFPINLFILGINKFWCIIIHNP